MTVPHLSQRLAGLFLCLALVACGGGGGGGGGTESSSTNTPQGAPGSQTLDLSDLPLDGSFFDQSLVTPNPSILAFRNSVDGTERVATSACDIRQRLGTPANDGARIDRVRWLQTVEHDPADVASWLVAGKSTVLRVNARTNLGLLGLSRPAAFVELNGACQPLAMTGPSLISNLLQLADFDRSYTVTVPAQWVQPGMRVIVRLDDADGRTASELDALIWVSQPRVAPAVTERIRLVPLNLNGFVSTLPEPAQVSTVVERLFPVTSTQISTASTITVTPQAGDLFSGNSGSFAYMLRTLEAVDNYCAAINGAVAARSAIKCVGVIPSGFRYRVSANGNFYTGLAYVSGVSLLTEGFSSADNLAVTSPYLNQHWMNSSALVFAHEFGHLMSLEHADCGGATGIDPRLPAQGLLGGEAGWDRTRGVLFTGLQLPLSVQPFTDVMSYCAKSWMSLKGYQAAHAYRLGGLSLLRTQGAAAAATAEPSWWRVHRDDQGVWHAVPTRTVPDALVPVSAAAQRGGQPVTLWSAQVSESDRQVGHVHEAAHHEPVPLTGVFYVEAPTDQPLDVIWTAEGAVHQARPLISLSDL